MFHYPFITKSALFFLSPVCSEQKQLLADYLISVVVVARQPGQLRLPTKKFQFPPLSELVSKTS